MIDKTKDVSLVAKISIVCNNIIKVSLVYVGNDRNEREQRKFEDSLEEE